MRKLMTLVPALLLSDAAWADGPVNSGDAAWMMTSTALVLFMSLPGLALFYGGLVRAKNVLSVLVQCFAIVCVVSLLWVIGAYSLAFTPGSGFIGGLSKAFLTGVAEDSVSGGIPETVFVMFQLTFAAITPALVVGGFAERMKFSAMLIFSVLWLLAVYVPVCHWVWGPGGWLAEMGVVDFAGGLVVHITAGMAALVAAIRLGRRRGFPHTPMMPHNMTMTVTGAGMLWVGWFGFNGGSALAADGNAGMAILVTHVSAAAGALMWSAIEWVKYGKPSALGIVTGMVAGLGTITPASGFVGPGGALVIGLVAGLICFSATHYLKRVLNVDDSLDVFPVHGVGGILGSFAVAIFASSQLGVFGGQGYAEGMTMGRQMVAQLIGIAAVGGYTGIVTWGLLALVDRVAGLRVSEEEETEGLDTTQHNERGYDLQTL
ncbi:MAG: ammonium transporter [Nevskiales bacterium]|nr:ammonium transporter [Nevskiales bacterium]